MNADRRFLRSRIRHDLLPTMEQQLGRDLRSTLARTAAHVRADADLLDSTASEAARRVVEVRDEELRLAADALVALPTPIGARVVRHAIRLAAAVGGEWEPDATAAHIGGVLDLARGRPGRRLDLPGDLVAERRKGYVRVSRLPPRAETKEGDEHRRRPTDRARKRG